MPSTLRNFKVSRHSYLKKAQILSGGLEQFCLCTFTMSPMICTSKGISSNQQLTVGQSKKSPLSQSHANDTHNSVISNNKNNKLFPYSIIERWARSLCQSIGSQPTDDLVINPVLGCHYFPPGF